LSGILVLMCTCTNCTPGYPYAFACIKRIIITTKPLNLLVNDVTTFLIKTKFGFDGTVRLSHTTASSLEFRMRLRATLTVPCRTQTRKTTFATYIKVRCNINFLH